jgi:hypothetical protein
VAGDADPLVIDFRHVRERVPAVGGDVRMERQRLALCVAEVGAIRIASRRADAERDEAALRELQCEVPLFAVLAAGRQADGRADVVVHDEDRGERPLPFRQQQPGFRRLAGCVFELDAAPDQAVAFRLFDQLDVRVLDERGPRAHLGHPVLADFAATLPPLLG